MEAVIAGEGIKDGQNGADYWMKYIADLPDYYITRDELLSLGWEKGKSPAKFAPGKMVTMGIYRNDDNRLPQISGRVWYEADINYYITRDELLSLGWEKGKSPAKFAPGKMVTMGIYRNDDNRLPQISGRVWYEADINYYSGRRNGHRLLWSNDGLLFVTYNHYEIFLEII